ncbi:uncharacterized transporter B0285.6-like [Ornithodoros turicata]|uniref:uncharacterized transporter B0285.6-like n=1 Tax=Ornithodoros turicata TaxID=34597 RepID=UPI00313949E9
MPPKVVVLEATNNKVDKAGPHQKIASPWQRTIASCFYSGHIAPLLLTPLLLARSQSPWLVYVFAVSLAWLILETIPVPMASLLPIFTAPTLDEYTPDAAFSSAESSLLNLLACGILVSAAEETNLFSRAALCLLATFGYRTRALLGAFSLCALCVSQLATKGPATLLLCALVDATIFEVQSDVIASTFPHVVERERPKQVITTVGVGEEQGATAISVLQMTPYTWTPESESSRNVLTPSGQTTDSSYSRLDKIKIEVEGVVRGNANRRSILKAEDTQQVAARRAQQFQAIRKGLLLGIAYCCILGGLGNATGDVAILPLQACFRKKYGEESVGILGWTMVGLPAAVLAVVLITVAIFYRYLYLHDFQEEKHIHHIIKENIRRKRNIIGERRKKERLFTTIYAVLCLAWKIQHTVPMFPSLEGYLHLKHLDDSTPSFIAVILMTVVCRSCDNASSSVCSRCETKRQPWCCCSVPWRALLTLSGGMALAKVAQAAGIVGLMLRAVRFQLTGWSPLQTQIALTVASSLLAELRVAKGLIAIAMDLGVQGKVHPLYYAFPVALARSTASLLPSATPAIAIVHSIADIRCTELVATGLVAKILAMIAITISVNLFGNDLYHPFAQITCANCSEDAGYLECYY